MTFLYIRLDRPAPGSLIVGQESFRSTRVERAGGYTGAGHSTHMEQEVHIIPERGTVCERCTRAGGLLTHEETVYTFQLSQWPMHMGVCLMPVVCLS